MTNSTVAKRKEIIGTEDQITQEIVRYVSNRDKEFRIDRLGNGLFKVTMVGGGVAPAICESLYTSHQGAEKELITYLIAGDRAGYAQYPGKEQNGESKN